MAPSRTPRESRFSGDRKIAWEGFLHCQAALTQQLARELDEAGEIPLGTYDILVQVSEAGGRVRLRDLVNRVVLSQPGLSRKVARLEQDGLLDRQPDPTDGRGVLVKISRSGRAALRSAAQVHLSGIERTFASRIDDDEAAVLAAVFTRLLAEQPRGEPVPTDGPEPGSSNGARGDGAPTRAPAAADPPASTSGPASQAAARRPGRRAAPKKASTSANGGRKTGAQRSPRVRGADQVT